MPAPPQSSSSEFPGLSAIRRTASTGAYTQILSHIPSIPSVSHLSQPSDDGDSSSDMSNGAVGINFSMQLKQFEHMQHQHRLHRVTQPQTKVPHKPPIAPVQVCFSWELSSLLKIVLYSWTLQLAFCFSFLMFHFWVDLELALLVLFGSICTLQAFLVLFCQMSP
jgi:hypothetical protein